MDPAIIAAHREPIVPRVTALPSNPVDLQTVDFIADANKGIVWRLRYRAASASAYKWECVGGPDLYTEVQGNITTAATETAPVELTGGPTITPALSGEYELAIEALMSVQEATAANLSVFLVKNKELATKTTWLIFISGAVTFNGAWMQNRNAIGLAGGATYSLYVGNNQPATKVLYELGRMSYRPIRVG